MIVQSIDHIHFKMNEAADFSFLSQYGKVFCVFDHNDSGNISFGVDNGKDRFFVKVAGAKTIYSCIEARQAVENLKKSISIYSALKHPNLIELIDHQQQGDLYAAVFKWVEGDCLFDYWNFEKYALDQQITSPRMRFKQLPIEKRLVSFNTIFDFLACVESKGFVAVDFYDGSILYDFAKDATTICDIDFFRKKPTFNDRGKDFWGTKRLKSPEEYIYKAVIDEKTNGYTLGALIFHYFGSYTENQICEMYKNNCFFPCDFEKWELSKLQYDIALKAVNMDRSKRYNTIDDFSISWNKGLHAI